jgi:hypothetical protein
MSGDDLIQFDDSDGTFVGEGFDPHEYVVPSKAGSPLETSLSPEDFESQSKEAFEAALDVIDVDVSFADY